MIPALRSARQSFNVTVRVPRVVQDTQKRWSCQRWSQRHSSTKQPSYVIRKPRAITEAEVASAGHYKRSIAFTIAKVLVFGGGTLVILHSLHHQISPWQTLRIWGDTFAEAIRALTVAGGFVDKGPEDIAAELRGILPPVTRLASTQRNYRPTLVIQLDGTAIDTPYDPRKGYAFILRPGLTRLILAAGQAGCEIVLWSTSRNSHDAEALFTTKLLPILVQEDRYRFMAFQRLLQQNLDKEIADEEARARGEGREPRRLRSMAFQHEIDAEYLTKLLAIHAILGKDQCFNRPDKTAVIGGETLVTHGGVMAIDCLPRPPEDVILVTSSIELATSHPKNVILIPSFQGREPPQNDPSFVLLAKILTAYNPLSNRMSIQEYLTNLRQLARVHTGSGLLSASHGHVDSKKRPLSESVELLSVALDDKLFNQYILEMCKLPETRNS